MNNKFILLSAFLISSLLLKADVKNVSSQNEFDEHLKNGPVCVDFHGEGFCEPCRKMSKPFKEYSEKYPQVKFIKVDTQQNPELAEKYQIGALPTFKTFKNGQERETIIGGNKANLEAAIKAISPMDKKKLENGGALVTLANEDELEETIATGKAIVVELEKDNCQFCKFTKVPFERLAEKYTDVVFTIINKKDFPEFETEYQDKIKGYPTFFTFKDGKLVGTPFTGATDDEDKNFKILDYRIRPLLGKGDNAEFTLKTETEVQKTSKKISKKTQPTAVQKQTKKLSRKEILRNKRMQNKNNNLQKRPVSECMPFCDTTV